MLTRRHRQAVNLYQSGNTCREIAVKLGCSPATVSRLMKEADVKPVAKGTRTKGLPDLSRRKFDRSEAIGMYQAGRSTTQIGVALGASPAAIAKALTNSGLELRDRHTSNSLRARGNKGRSSHGYIRVNTERRQRQYEHILVAELILGRPLKANERVHHVYCDRSDNKNLLICTHEYHLALHARMRAHPYWSQFGE
jgi:helix-turn-helix protein